MRIRRQTFIAALVGLAASLTLAACNESSAPPDPPPTATITVVVTTTGNELDADGYVVSVDSGSARVVGVNASTSFVGLEVGSHVVQLGGLAGNCGVTGLARRTLDVAAGDTVAAEFAISCMPKVSLHVTTATTGSGTDADGYLVKVDDAAGQAIAVNGALDFTGLSAGPHSVTLSGLAASCTVGSANPLTITVTTGQTTAAAFSVTCTIPPNVSLHVTTTTTGAGTDPDGYLVQVDAGVAQAIGVNGALDVADLSAGQHTLTLSGMAAGCTLQTANPLSFAVATGQVTSVALTVTCGLGGIRVTTTTTGGGTDPDGYLVKVDNGAARSIGLDGALDVTDLTTGQHAVTLSGLAANCTLGSTNPLTITVIAGETAPAAFSVTCTVPPPPPPSSIRVTTATTGLELDPDGYLASLDGSPALSISSNGTLVFPNVSVGSHEIQLSGASANCDISGANPRPVTVASGVAIEVAFTVVCVATGSVRVTTTTTGIAPDPDGYSFGITDPVSNSFIGGGVPTNGSTTVTGLRPGSYVVTLFGLAGNCALVSPMNVTVSSGTATAASFAVACGPLDPLAFVVKFFQIFAVTPDGSRVTQLTTNSTSDDPAWSPDGMRIVFTSQRDGNSEIYVMNRDGSNPVRLTSNTAMDSRPAWSPDGQKIAFVSDRDRDQEIYVMQSDGTSPVRLTNHFGLDGDPAWSPDGGKIAFVSGESLGAANIYVMNADGSAPLRLTSSFSPGNGAASPAWSPDGNRIAFSRSSSSYFGSYTRIFVMNANGSNVTLLRTTSSLTSQDREPAWSPDGRRIAYTNQPSASSTLNFILIVAVDGSSSPRTFMQGRNPAWRR